MIRTNDIYYTIDSNIVEKGFWEVDTDEKKELIDKELRQYIISKINETSPHILTESNKDLSTVELLEILGNEIPKEAHNMTLCHFTHYILNVASCLQYHGIIWKQDKDEELITLPRISFDENNLWDDLTTHEKTDYVKTFAFTYDIFQNNFMKENNNKKTLKLTSHS